MAQMVENANNYPPRFANAAFDIVAFAASAGGLNALAEVLSTAQLLPLKHRRKTKS